MDLFIAQLQKNPPFFFAVVITVVVSITIHELAHGIVAVWLGDRTPIERGHMTLNPAVHLGVFSVIALLVAGIAWGAMPVDPTRMRGRYADALVSIAGPLSNALLALLALTSLGLWWRYGGYMQQGTPGGNLQFLLWVFGWTNFNLMLFNLIPVPPLDGAGVLANFSSGFRRLSEQMMASGASMIVFMIAFAAAGMLTGPLAGKMTRGWLELIIG